MERMKHKSPFILTHDRILCESVPDENQKLLVKLAEKTGRTTRMIAHARELAKQQKAVYIVAANEQHADTMRKQLGYEPHGIKVETEGSLNNLDWKTMTLRGAHPNCAILVDHYTIESRFGRMLEMLARYDVANQDLPE